MTKDALTISEETSVETAARIMRDQGVGFLPVGDEDNIAGVVTDRDIATRATAEARDARRTPVREIMTRNSAYCFEDQDIEDACFMMEEKRLRRLLVFNRQRCLAGILSLDDVATRGWKDKLVGYTLRKVGKAA
jgi:CBS domain-containing protein